MGVFSFVVGCECVLMLCLVIRKGLHARVSNEVDVRDREKEIDV